MASSAVTSGSAVRLVSGAKPRHRSPTKRNGPRKPLTPPLFRSCAEKYGVLSGGGGLPDSSHFGRGEEKEVGGREERE